MKLSESKLRKIIRDELARKNSLNEGLLDWATEGVQLVNAVKDFVKVSGGGYNVSTPEMLAIISTISSKNIKKFNLIINFLIQKILNSR